MTGSFISIGELVRRSGVAASALRYYEEQGLLRSVRETGGRRRYSKEALRRVAFIRAAQQLGLRLEDICSALETLPEQRTPNKKDWEALSASWRPLLDKKIQDLMRLRDQLSSCIGCGCLSLQACALFNHQDAAAGYGTGSRYLYGDKPIQASNTATPARPGKRKSTI